MEEQTRSRWKTHFVIRLTVAVLVGLVVVVLVGFTAGWTCAPTVGWIAAACVYLGWTWIVVLPMDADQTRDHVGPEDPPRGWVTDVIILSASVASLAGVGHLLAAGSKAGVEKDVAERLKGIAQHVRDGRAEVFTVLGDGFALTIVVGPTIPVAITYVD